MDEHILWAHLRQETQETINSEPALSNFLKTCLLEQPNFLDAVAAYLGRKLGTNVLPTKAVESIFKIAFESDPQIGERIRRDLEAFFERDPACNQYLVPFLYFKGFHSLTAYRIAHQLWEDGRTAIAFYFQSLISEIFSADIHPAARIGGGILLDHGTGFVVGETSVIGNDVSILHEVTLGGTGKEHGDRHPKVQSGVLIGAGAKILGNVTIGTGAKIGAGSVVLDNVPAHMTVVGVPAKAIYKNCEETPAFGMEHKII